MWPYLLQLTSIKLIRILHNQVLIPVLLLFLLFLLLPLLDHLLHLLGQCLNLCRLGLQNIVQTGATQILNVKVQNRKLVVLQVALLDPKEISSHLRPQFFGVS